MPITHHIIAMRKVPWLLTLALATGCSFPETRWEKSGTDERIAAIDLSACYQAARQEVRQEAFETWPYAAYGPPYWGFPYWNWGMPYWGSGIPYWGPVYWAQADSFRFHMEGRLTDFCMRSKGYQLVTVSQPQARPPAAPPVAK